MILHNTTSYRVAGTKFFRLGSKALFSKWPQEMGGNLQNIEKSARRMYVPNKEGHVFVQCDESGADALIVAYLCRDGRYRQLFQNNVKPHVYVALYLFADVWKRKLPHLDIDSFINAPIANLQKMDGWKELDTLIKSTDDWPASERYYFLAKGVCHSSNYDARAGAIQMHILDKSKGKVAIRKEDAERFRIIYNNELFPEIQAWRDELRHSIEGKPNPTLYTIQGYPIEFTTEITDTSIKECYAAIPSSSVAIIIHIAYTDMQYEIIEEQSKPWDLMQNNHDSYLVRCPFTDKEECGQVMKQLISRQTYVSPKDGVNFSMKSEAMWGHNWYELNKL